MAAAEFGPLGAKLSRDDDDALIPVRSGGDSCPLRAPRGRPDVVLDYRSMEDGLDEPSPRYIFPTDGAN